ncbi:amino acid ABC transporter substrate-binding protein [Pararhizobium polonicum]|uniref:Amino acid ABC transporter substrate-binding protein n=1 Tax=Pararhizobium polonicum TaxID=1612624 RepID=A0A1C7P7U3_9HYPH|nr:transporter substrate-binding domain-containing protein [Pararhizobium polonicum]OBZ97287.1 amino acid ABC transporter substrate-binding protein [Pararhizobium polonicum]
MSDFDVNAIREEIAPSGTLVCALNHGNVVLVRRGETDENPTGVSVDLARELAQTLSLPIRFRHYDKAGDVSASAGTGAWDICFLAIDPKRAERITYSSPYVQIEGAFVVARARQAKMAADVDLMRLRIGAVKGSAYELFLSRNGGAGDLVRFDSFPEATSALAAGELDGLAGVRQAMQKVANEMSDFEIIPEPFMAIQQAVGLSSERRLASDFVSSFIDRKKADGFVRRSLDASGHADVVIPD